MRQQPIRRKTDFPFSHSTVYSSHPDNPGILDVLHEPVPSLKLDPVKFLIALHAKIFCTGRTNTKLRAVLSYPFHDFGSISKLLKNGRDDLFGVSFLAEVCAFDGHPDMHVPPSLLENRIRHEERPDGAVRVIATVGHDDDVLPFFPFLR